MVSDPSGSSFLPVVLFIIQDHHWCRCVACLLCLRWCSCSSFLCSSCFAWCLNLLFFTCRCSLDCCSCPRCSTGCLLSCCCRTCASELLTCCCCLQPECSFSFPVFSWNKFSVELWFNTCCRCRSCPLVQVFLL